MTDDTNVVPGDAEIKITPEAVEAPIVGGGEVVVEDGEIKPVEEEPIV